MKGIFIYCTIHYINRLLLLKTYHHHALNDFKSWATNFSLFSFATTGLRSLKSIGGRNSTVNISTKKGDQDNE